MANYSYSFYTEVQSFAYPSAYDQETNLTTLPSDWVTSGTPPIFSVSGMSTGAGNSYITKTFPGDTDFSGLLIDVSISVQTPYATTKILEVVNNNFDVVSVYVDIANHEVWLDNVNGTPISKFRPAVRGNTIDFRLSIKNVDNLLIARLYAKSPASSTEFPILQQTLGPSLKTSSSNYISFGSIDAGGSPIESTSFAYLFDNPDKYYAFPKIKHITPQSLDLVGGEKIKIELERDIDIGVGEDVFRNDNGVNDESTGTGSINVSGGSLRLSLAGVGTARARFTNSYSGDVPSCANIVMDIEINQTLINKSLLDITLFGMEMGVNGTVIAVELQADPVSGAYFRISQTYATNVVSTSKVGITTLQNKHTLSLIRGKSTISFLINGIEAYKTNIGSGVGRLAVYTKSLLPVTTTAYVTNFKVRPVVTIGENAVII